MIGVVVGIAKASKNSTPLVPAGMASTLSVVSGVAAVRRSPQLDITAGPTVVSGNVGWHQSHVNVSALNTSRPASTMLPGDTSAVRKRTRTVLVGVMKSPTRNWCSVHWLLVPSTVSTVTQLLPLPETATSNVSAPLE